jgi:hypothetical protein
MSEYLSQTSGEYLDVDLTPSETPSIVPQETARDGSPALRPGDAAPSGADEEPIFSTDPLAGRR